MTKEGTPSGVALLAMPDKTPDTVGRGLFVVIRTLNYSMKLASPHNLKHISPSKNALGNSRVIYELRH